MATIACPKCQNVIQLAPGNSRFACPQCGTGYVIEIVNGKKTMRFDQPQPQPAASPSPVLRANSVSLASLPNVELIGEYQGGSETVKIFQYKTLAGSYNLDVGRTLYYAERSKMFLKQVCIELRSGEVILEAGALQFMRGNVEISTSGDLIKGLASSFLTAESAVKPRYRGTGEVYLEPSFGHFIIAQLNNETMVVDKGLFYAAQATVDVGVEIQKNLSAGLAGGEGWFQTRISGSGWVVLNVPVPVSEIVKVRLNGDKLSVDGSFALLRKGNVDFRVERSTKSLFGSARSGEGLLQTFSGYGEVWLAPTQSVYQQLGFLTMLPRVTQK